MSRPGQLHRAEYLSRRTEFAVRGEDLPHTKLTDQQVLAIRTAAAAREQLRGFIRDNLSNDALARAHGVHHRTVEKVLSYESWCHVRPPAGTRT